MLLKDLDNGARDVLPPYFIISSKWWENAFLISLESLSRASENIFLVSLQEIPLLNVNELKSSVIILLARMFLLLILSTKFIAEHSLINQCRLSSFKLNFLAFSCDPSFISVTLFQIKKLL